MKERKRQRFTAGKDYIVRNGLRVEIDPTQIPGLSDRCLLAIAEITTGKKYKLVEKEIV